MKRLRGVRGRLAATPAAGTASTAQLLNEDRRNAI